MRGVGDVAAHAVKLPDGEWLEVALLRIVPADRFLDGAGLEPGPTPRSLTRAWLLGEFGDIATRFKFLPPLPAASIALLGEYMPGTPAWTLGGAR